VKDIYLDGYIGGNWGLFTADLQGQAEVTVYVNSFGGSVTEGFALADAIKRHSAANKVQMIGTGFIASIASIILLAGAKGSRKMTENSFLMIHRPTASQDGNADQLRSVADVMDVMEAKLINVYFSVIAENGKLINGSEEETRAQIKAWLDAETWFSAQEALDAGLIDEIVEPSAYDVASVQNTYKNMPEKVKNALSKMENKTEPISETEKTLFGKFLTFLGFTVKNEAKPEPETVPEDKQIEKNPTENMEMTPEQLQELAIKRGLEVVKKEEEVETEMTDAELMAALEAAGYTAKAKTAAPENSAAAELKRLKEENARLLLAQQRPKGTEQQPVIPTNETPRERAMREVANQYKNSLEGQIKAINNRLNGGF
jgi:ATP-dependent Clp endopeptidase proteolytic subunit ClpP